MGRLNGQEVTTNRGRVSHTQEKGYLTKEKGTRGKRCSNRADHLPVRKRSIGGGMTPCRPDLEMSGISEIHQRS